MTLYQRQQQNLPVNQSAQQYAYQQYVQYRQTGYGQYNQQYNQQCNQQFVEYRAVPNNNAYCNYPYNTYPCYQQRTLTSISNQYDCQQTQQFGQFTKIKENKIAKRDCMITINNNAAVFPNINRRNMIHHQNDHNNIVPLTPTANLQISLFSNQYTLIKRIDDGTFGDVWKIKNNSNNQQYALKLIKKNIGGKDVDIIKRQKYDKAFYDEANKLKYLNNLKTKELGKEFIIKFYGLSISSSIGTALLLELGQESLFEYIKFHKENKLQISLDTIRSISVQLLSALSFIHGTGGMMHCDLKPKNILINKKNKSIKLIDFGNCLLYNNKIKSFEIQTLWYRAPELLFGQNDMISSSIDLWSIGCILSQLYMVNKPPLFASNTYNKLNVIYKIWKYYTPYPQYLYNHYKSCFYKNIYKNDRFIHYYDEWKDTFHHNEHSYIKLKENRKSKLTNIMRAGSGHNNIDVNNAKFTDFVDLISCLLDLNPLTRYNSEDAIRHKFIMQDTFDQLSEIDIKQNRKIKISTDKDRQNRIDNQIIKYKLNVKYPENTELTLFSSKIIIKQYLY